MNLLIIISYWLFIITSYCSSTKVIDMKNRTKANQLTNELIRLKLLNKNKKKITKIILFGDNQDQGVAIVNEIKRVNALQN